MIFFDFEDGFWYVKIGDSYKRFVSKHEAELELESYYRLMEKFD